MDSEDNGSVGTINLSRVHVNPYHPSESAHAQEAPKVEQQGIESAKG